MKIKDAKGLVTLRIKLDTIDLNLSDSILSKALRVRVEQMVTKYIGPELIKDIIISEVYDDHVIAVVRLMTSDDKRTESHGTLIRFRKKRD